MLVEAMSARVRAAFIHFLVSLCIILPIGVIIFGVWYPSPYRSISGGGDLFSLLMFVDMMLGPLITFVIFSRQKSVWILRRDIFIVVLLQLSALGYGVWSIAVARPVHLVFEIDRFRIVHAIEVERVFLEKALPSLQSLPWNGPTLLAVRPFRSMQEKMEATVAALQGVHLGYRADLWIPYQQAIPAILAAAKPTQLLIRRFPEKATLINAELVRINRSPESIVALPLVARASYWTVFLDPLTAEVISFIPLDSF